MMNYYKLEKDDTINEVPKNLKYNVPLNLDYIEKINPVIANMPSSKEFKSIIVKPLLLFPKELKDILNAFEPWLEFKDFVLINEDRTFNHLFLYPLLEEVEGWPEDINNVEHALFVVKEEEKRTTVIREDLASALIQDYYLGYKLVEI